jgi:hypothetical protein
MYYISTRLTTQLIIIIVNKGVLVNKIHFIIEINTTNHFLIFGDKKIPLGISKQRQREHIITTILHTASIMIFVVEDNMQCAHIFKT